MQLQFRLHRHPPVLANGILHKHRWHGHPLRFIIMHSRIAVAAGVSIPARARLAIAAGVSIAVAWRVRYSVDRSKQLGLVSFRHSVCAIARRLRAIPSKRAEQLLGVTAAAYHVNNAQFIKSVSERLLLSTDRSCGPALLQPDVVWHGNERCIPDLHPQPMRVGFAIASGVAIAVAWCVRCLLG